MVMMMMTIIIIIIIITTLRFSILASERYRCVCAERRG
jgi:hypothetical protein